MAADWTDDKVPLYAISTDTASGVVDVGRLHEEVRKAGIANAADFINAKARGDVLRLSFSTSVVSGDQPTIDTVISNHGGVGFSVRHTEEEYNASNDIIRRSLYSDESGGTLSMLCKETIFTYVSGDLSTEVTKKYGLDGTVLNTTTYNHSETTQGSNTIKKRILQ